MTIQTSEKSEWRHPALQALYKPRAYKVLLPVANLHEAALLLPLAEAMINHNGGSLTVAHVVSVPEGQSLSEAASQASESRQMIAQFLQENSRFSAEINSVVRVSREVWDGIWETVDAEGIDLMVLGWESDNLLDTAAGAIAHPKLHNPPCNIIVVRPGSNLSDPDGWNTFEKVLLAIRVGRKSSLSLRLSNAVASEFKSDITFLHVAGPEDGLNGRQIVTAFASAIRKLPHFRRSVTASGEVDESILAEARGHSLIIMGAPTRSVSEDGWSGSPLDRVAADYDGTLIVVKRRTHELEDDTEDSDPDAAEEVLAPERVALIVDKWFAENTFRSEEFEDISHLIALKEKQGLTISLGLPALNEEETVGTVIKTVKKALMDDYPLLDEIALIDSDSVDYTREIAADLGIPVHIHQQILPGLGAHHGKGEALWKSLYVLKGDVIAWIDTDIKNIHPRFVYGVLGPILREPRIRYTKGFYRRPLKEGDKLVEGGGGRVTELAARPLVNLFFPRLSGLIQPLSGEYAGRREVLERMPFFTGYGVETGLLIDILGAYGLDSIAQVDLRQRIHHNQPLPSLSKMANVIIQVVVRRLEDRHKIRLLEDINKSMNLIRYEDGGFYLDTQEIIERERPPMIEIPEYRDRFARRLETLASENRT